MVDHPTTPGQIVGRNVRAAREEQLLSQRELAERSGVAKITIATMELGKSAHPRRRTVEKLASALGVPVEDLIREDLTRPKAEALPSLEPTLFNGLAEERRAPELSGWTWAALEESAFIERFEQAKESEEAARRLHREEVEGLDQAEARASAIARSASAGEVLAVERDVEMAKARTHAAAILWSKRLGHQDVSTLDPVEIVADIFEARREQRERLDQAQDEGSEGSASEAG